MTCPGDEVLAQWAAGGLDEHAREAVRTHLTLCARCRSCAFDDGLEPWPGPEGDAWEASSLRQRALSLVPRRILAGGWVRPVAIAAALLLSLALAGFPKSGPKNWQGKPGEGLPGGAAPGSGDPSSAPFPLLPSSPLFSAEGSDREVLLGTSALLRLKQDSRARLLEDGTLQLEAGALLAEEPSQRVFQVGPARIFLEGGILLLECEETPRAMAGNPFLLQAAWADAEPRWRVLLREGKARVTLDGKEHALVPGQEIRGGDFGAGGVPVAAWGETDDTWRVMEGLPTERRDGIQQIAPPEVRERYLCEAVFRRGASTGVSLRLSLPGGGIEVPLGHALVRAGGAWVRVRALVSGSGKGDILVSLFVGQEEILRATQEEALKRYGIPAEASSCALVCWGGRLETSLCRWKRAT